MSELLCPKHGPYDASYGACPYCQAEGGGRPVAPRPLGLSEDDLETDIGGGAAVRNRSSYDDDEPTDLGRGGSQRILDDDEITDIGGHAEEDVTELDWEQVKTGPLGYLIVSKGPRRGKVYPIKDNALIGRKEGDLVLNDAKVSNPHAKLRFKESEFVLTDFDTTNGTFVNGQRISAATPIKENDEIKIGETIFVFKVLM